MVQHFFTAASGRIGPIKIMGNLNEYPDKFKRITCRSNLTEDQKLDSYLGGLMEEFAWDVRLFHLRTVLEAIRLAKIKEMSIRSNSKAGTVGSKLQKGITTLTRGQGAYQDQRGILGKMGYKFQSRMSPTELEEHKQESLLLLSQKNFKWA